MQPAVLNADSVSQIKLLVTNVAAAQSYQVHEIPPKHSWMGGITKQRKIPWLLAHPFTPIILFYHQ